MVMELVVDIGLGVYLGILAGIFPAVVAFALGFVFKYLTGVSVPGLGVVVLAGALAGISGGLLGLLDETVAQSASGMTAFLVVLMLSLWAHSQGDKLGDSVPRHVSFSQLHRTGFSAEFLERVDSYGQLRIKPVGTIEDIDGFPPLSEETRTAIRDSTWKFPASLSRTELEAKLTERLMAEFGLSEVEVSITADGLAEISAAPETATLSRRVPSGMRAVSVETLLPTALAVGDRVSLTLPDEEFQGMVVSAKTKGGNRSGESAGKTGSTNPEPPVAETATEPKTDGGTEAPQELPPQTPTTDGGYGSVTVALPETQARRVIRAEFAKLTVHSRGNRREYALLNVLREGNTHLQLVTVGKEGPLDGVRIEEGLNAVDEAVSVLAIRRKTERFIAPPAGTKLAGEDELIVAGKPAAIRKFREVVA